MDKDDKPGGNIEEDFDDFGFGDGDEDEFAEGEDDSFASEEPAPAAAATEEASAAGSSANFSDELLAEMEKSETKKTSGVPYQEVIDWAKENKLIAGAGAGVAMVIFVFTMMGGGNTQQAQQPVLPPPTDIAQNTPQAQVAGDDKKSIEDFFKDEEAGLDAFEYKAKEEYEDKPQDLAALGEADKAAAPVENSPKIKEHEAKLNDLQARLDNIEAQLSTLQGMSKVVTKVSGDLDKRDNAVKLNQQNIKRVEAAIAALNASVQQVKRDRFRGALLEHAEFVAGGGQSNQHADYIVMASIPGRAWLRNQDGVLITVREGEAVPGFGKVKKIDPALGEVIMDDETVFKEEE